MRESTEIKLVKAAKSALASAGLREITTQRQEKNGTSAWRCDESGYEFCEYVTGYVRRQSVPGFYRKTPTDVYLPEEWIHFKGNVRKIEAKVNEISHFELIEDKHSRLLYILAFYLRNKERFINTKRIRDLDEERRARLYAHLD
jgi:hypothetical protein